jgi:ribosomal protein L11 methyltransferase
MEWLEICVNCEPEHAEAVAEVLSRYAPGGVAIQQNALDLTGEEWRPDGPLESVASVRAYLPVEPGLDEKQRRVEEALWHLRQIVPIPEPQFRTVAEEQWANAWKEHFHVTRIGQRDRAGPGHGVRHRAAIRRRKCACSRSKSICAPAIARSTWAQTPASC